MKQLKPKSPSSAGGVMQYCAACTRTVNVEQSPDTTCTSPPWCRRAASQIAKQGEAAAQPKPAKSFRYARPTRPIGAANSDKVFRKVSSDGPIPRRSASRGLKTRLVATTREIKDAKYNKDNPGAPLKPYGGNDLGDGLTH